MQVGGAAAGVVARLSGPEQRLLVLADQPVDGLRGAALEEILDLHMGRPFTTPGYGQGALFDATYVAPLGAVRAALAGTDAGRVDLARHLGRWREWVTDGAEGPGAVVEARGLVARDAEDLDQAAWTRLSALVDADLGARLVGPRRLHVAASLGDLAWSPEARAAGPDDVARYLDGWRRALDPDAPTFARREQLADLLESATSTPRSEELPRWEEIARLAELDEPLDASVSSSASRDRGLAAMARAVTDGRAPTASDLEGTLQEWRRALRTTPRGLTPAAAEVEVAALLARQPTTLTADEWERFAAIVRSDPEGALVAGPREIGARLAGLLERTAQRASHHTPLDGEVDRHLDAWRLVRSEEGSSPTARRATFDRLMATRTGLVQGAGDGPDELQALRSLLDVAGAELGIGPGQRGVAARLLDEAVGSADPVAAAEPVVRGLARSWRADMPAELARRVDEQARHALRHEEPVDPRSLVAVRMGELAAEVAASVPTSERATVLARALESTLVAASQDALRAMAQAEVLAAAADATVDDVARALADRPVRAAWTAADELLAQRRPATRLDAEAELDGLLERASSTFDGRELHRLAALARLDSARRPAAWQPAIDVAPIADARLRGVPVSDAAQSAIDAAVRARALHRTEVSWAERYGNLEPSQLTSAYADDVARLSRAARRTGIVELAVWRTRAPEAVQDGSLATRLHASSVALSGARLDAPDDLRAPLVQVLDVLEEAGTLDGPGQGVAGRAVRMTEENLARLDHRYRGDRPGYRGHPDYAELGVLRVDLSLLGLLAAGRQA